MLRTVIDTSDVNESLKDNTCKRIILQHILSDKNFFLLLLFNNIQLFQYVLCVSSPQKSTSEVSMNPFFRPKNPSMSVLEQR